MASAAKQHRQGRRRKTERLLTHVTPSAKAAIRRAIAISGLAPGDLAYEGARRVLEDQERIVLAGKDREALLRALSNPPEPPAHSIKGLRRRRRLFD